MTDTRTLPLPAIPAPKARAQRAKLTQDQKAVAAVRGVGTHNKEGNYHGFIPAETLAFLYRHIELLAKELVEPNIHSAVPAIALSVEKLRKTQLGHYKVGRDGLGLRWRIVIGVLTLAHSRGDVVRVLLHELLHAVQHEHGTPSKTGHNAEFRGWCARLGAPTDAQGHDLGTEKGGLFSEYCTRHELVGRLLTKEEKKELPKAGGSKLKKWSCSCEKPVNVRVAILDFDATCNVCESPFTLQE